MITQYDAAKLFNIDNTNDNVNLSNCTSRKQVHVIKIFVLSRFTIFTRVDVEIPKILRETPRRSLIK